MMERILMSAPDTGELEEEYVVAAMRTGWIAPVGPDVDDFERELKDRVGRRHAVAMSSGTAALHLALLATGVKANDVVLTSTMTFAATANAITYTGAVPYFIDSEEESGNIDPSLLSRALKELGDVGITPAAIVPVDLLGKAANYTEITELARKFDVPVIADAAEALGATHKGRSAGAWGEASILSFNGNKILTTSGGGMLLTDNESLAARVRYLSTQARQPVAHYEHLDIGYNYRLSNLLAALGRAQLLRLDEMMERRRRMRQFYRTLFDGFYGVRIFGGDDDSQDNYWLTSIVVDSSETGWSASALRDYLATQQIESRPLWKPMHLQPVFRGAKALVNGTSESLFNSGLTLPSGSSLSESQIARIRDSVLAFMQTANQAARSIGYSP